jgi:reductive dehalogenase
MNIRQCTSSPYTVNKDTLSRFDQRDTIFGRMVYDKKADFYKKGMYDNVEKILSEHKKGYSRVEFAQVLGSWAVYDYFHMAFSWLPPKDANSVMEKPKFEKVIVADKKKMSDEVKKIAQGYGASLVGITKINPTWIYSYNLEGDSIEFPEEIQYAIVIAIEMNPELIIQSPTFIACAETGLVYSKMAFVIGCVAEFIRNLGYNAIPMGNDTALSIPLAIDAGLGELGRNGLLITPEYGPCVRLCKIFTDLPLAIDIPIEFGIHDFCKQCKKCADACEADAIQTVKKPSFNIVCRSNAKGVLKWAVNQEKCYKYWIKNGGDCSNCIAACPFFPLKKRFNKIRIF